jgi:hypothetical protein
MCWSSCRRREGGLLLQLAIRCGVGKFHTSKLPRCWPAATGPAAGRGIHGWPRCIGLCSPASWDVHRGRVLQWDRPHPTLAGLPRLTDIRLLRVGRGSKSTLLRSSSCGLLLGPKRWAATKRRRLRSMASDSDCSRSSSSVPLARLAPHTGGAATRRPAPLLLTLLSRGRRIRRQGTRHPDHRVLTIFGTIH